MTWHRFRSQLQAQWKLLVICFLIGGAGAFVLSEMGGFVYISSAVVQVNALASGDSSDIGALQASTQLALTDARLANSYPILQQVAPHYDGLTEEALAREVSVSARPGTSLFEIDIQDSSPERAASLANDISAALIQQQIATLNQSNASMQTQIQQELKKTQDQINSTLSQMNALQSSNQAKAEALQAELEAQEQHYMQWQGKQALLGFSQAQSNNFLRVVQPAEPNYTAARPDVLMNMEVGLLVGLVLGVLFLVLYDLLDTHVHTVDAVRRLLDWPLLGTIWLANAEAKEQAFNPHKHEINAEAYRLLRTNLGFTHVEPSLCTLAVTSVGPGEGKSTVAANLAIFMARAGKNTLLIDADMRRPALHTLFQITPDKPGLSNALVSMSAGSGATGQFAIPARDENSSTGKLGANAAQHALESFFHYVGLPNLRVMPAGILPPNPSELLESKTMQYLIALLKTSGADVVIFDTPPAFGLADVSVLAARVDGTLMVVDPAIPTRAQMEDVKTSLTRAGAHVVGCVVNRQIPTRADLSAFHYYDSEQGPQGIAAMLSHLLIKKEYPSSTETAPANREKGQVHTAYHDRNPL